MVVGKVAGALFAGAIVAGVALAAMAQQNHTMGGMSGMQSHDSKTMTDAMERMNRDMMAAPKTGDADRDFVAMMIPHHQGAIAMAKAVLANGNDPEIRKLAEDIVAAQEHEIAQMRAWQQKHPVKP